MYALFKMVIILVELVLLHILKNTLGLLILLILKIVLEGPLQQELVIFSLLDKEKNLGSVYLKEMVCTRLFWIRGKENYLIDLDLFGLIIGEGKIRTYNWFFCCIFYLLWNLYLNLIFKK